MDHLYRGRFPLTKFNHGLPQQSAVTVVDALLGQGNALAVALLDNDFPIHNECKNNKSVDMHLRHNV
jgi:hypothetical protein